MLFNSFEFLGIFLPATLIAVALSARLGSRLISLSVVCIASAIFYAMYSLWHLLLLCGMIAFNWSAAGAITRSSRHALALGVFINLCVLLLFKYTAFAMRQVFGSDVDVPSWALTFPLAISFYTFHQISFLVDVSRKRATRPDLLTYATYVLLFPQLIAGPIVRYSEVAFQLGRKIPVLVRSRPFRIGVILLVLGLAKKILIADELAPGVDAAFANSSRLSTVQAWQAALGFGFQIYFDFSGYTDMAIGMALMIGLRFPRNFDSPYRAVDISDFWRRWHITLSRFLRDYLYKPLGGNRRGLARTLVNLMTVMLLGGLWHGANWTFVIWGGLHGLYLVIHRLWSQVSPVRLPMVLSSAVTFVAVTIAWVFFRAPNLVVAGEVLRRMFWLFPESQMIDAAVVTLWIAAAIVWLAPQSRAVALRYHRSNWLAVLLGTLASAATLKMLSNAGHQDAFIYFAF
ncbi:MBOAT family protein [Bradyrhizobium frederickii]|uniref:Probable alginate O-acetylase AlgI n=1 Tax=Bradyrhizobium frederickii TaxID=2560054 RepID=A0A4Y9KT55_9BRAD|nr:MBOAT family O-acyltransferase [Bradyrhizobium frederickii]TFV34541.1 MBOAT family protein [Bradyrhizobium frederickii]